MKQNLFLSMVVGFALLSGVGCSKSSGGTDNSSVSAPQAAVGFKAANDTISAASGMVKNTLSFSSLATNESVHIMGAFGSVWTNPFLPDPRCSGGSGDAHCGGGSTGTLQSLMGFMTDASAVRDNGSSINIFGRLKTEMSTACAVSSLLSVANGGTLPTTGTFTVAFSSTTASILTSYCGMDSSEIPASGTTATITMTAASPSTYYDSNMSINVGGNTFTYLMRVNDTTLNISSVENNGGTNFSRMWVALNRTTNVVRAEYASYSTSGFGAGEMHRLYFDSVNHIGSMVGSSYDFQVNPNQYIFAMAGTPGITTGQTALSMTVKGFGIHAADNAASNTSFNSYKGCVTSSTGAIASDNTVSCSGGVTGADTSGTLLTNFSQFISYLNGNGAGLSDSSVYGAGFSVPFASASDIFTTAFPIYH